MIKMLTSIRRALAFCEIREIQRERKFPVNDVGDLPVKDGVTM